jgi:hypothetical protein
MGGWCSSQRGRPGRRHEARRQSALAVPAGVARGGSDGGGSASLLQQRSGRLREGRNDRCHDPGWTTELLGRESEGGLPVSAAELVTTLFGRLIGHPGGKSDQSAWSVSCGSTGAPRTSTKATPTPVPGMDPVLFRERRSGHGPEGHVRPGPHQTRYQASSQWPRHWTRRHCPSRH